MHPYPHHCLLERVDGQALRAARSLAVEIAGATPR
jgi:hypothetical protein